MLQTHAGGVCVSVRPEANNFPRAKHTTTGLLEHVAYVQMPVKSLHHTSPNKEIELALEACATLWWKTYIKRILREGVRYT